jgi:hypothetical protein
MIKTTFDRIKSCSVLKFVLNLSRHCSLGPDPAFSSPASPHVRTWPTRSRAAHACRPLPCTHTAPDTTQPASVSTAPVQLPGCRAPCPPCHAPPTTDPPPLPLFCFALDQAVRRHFFLLHHSRRCELSPTGLQTAPTSPLMSRIRAGVLLRAPEPLLPH